MKMREQQILLRAGFRIFRMEEAAMRIRECKGAGAWCIQSNHKSKAGMRRAWAELMKDEKNMEG